MEFRVLDDFLTFIREERLSHAAEQLHAPADELPPDRRAGTSAGCQTVQAQQPHSHYMRRQYTCWIEI